MFVVGPKAAVKEIYARIEGSKEVKDTPGFFTFPCASRIPPISITFGEHELFMEPETVKFAPISRGSDTCKGSIVYEEKFGIPSWILGSSFMANFYTIFDFDKKRIGFATPNPNPTE
jgi:Eukaryotic aspartyl protease